MKTRVAILISGRGSNMMALVEAAKAADYPATIAAIISNRPEAGGLEYAQVNDIATEVVDHKAFASREDFDRALHERLKSHDIELICLAGFMRLLTPWFVDQWAGKILNIHPSLLPLFKGLHPHKQALEAGVRIHGCSIHIVTPEMDAGPIVAQAAVPVLHNDTDITLGERVLKVEHELYPHALALMASGKAKAVNGRVEFTAGLKDISSLPLLSPRLENR
jgi:phosphoribosylglycinamide formyltransferase 1